jgi:phosphoribosylformylglycinamidine synthase subunit PurQ / glutaminase
MDIGIVVFPGSNCDADTFYAVRDVLGSPAHRIWHEESSFDGLDAMILPGGFAYGDYLRAGAIAATSPCVRGLRPYVAAGGLVLGICNGFQVLLEAGLLPGAMQPNAGGEFRCRFVHVRAERVDTPFTCALEPGQVLRLPIAHAEGRYYVNEDIRAGLAAARGVVFRYCDGGGAVRPEANPNGAADAIAGIASPAGAVVGLMPHPERAVEELLGSADGRLIFESLARWHDRQRQNLARRSHAGAVTSRIQTGGRP